MAKILVVDDEQVFCELLKTLLKSHGHEVLTAYNGRQGLELFKQHRPQFTMLDLSMPEMNGMEMLKQIRAIDTKASVMILTATGTDASEMQARKLGVTDFLSKAISLDAIIESLKRGLTQPAQPADATPTAATGTLEANTILLIDNKQKTRDLFARYLNQHGFQVSVIRDGATALALVDQERPQLIVLDMDYPDFPGIEVLRALRSKRYTGGIIVMTFCEDEKLLKEVLDLGAVDILGKPVEPERLMVAIQVGLVLMGK